ncbi:signal transducer and activator of transcription 6 isoform X1 [Gadus macrocephalus]|uniref:signal transducer and activator of transcription 6 isoform X1 n=2 Tax=Gadus macrocephalus TaxID=80720 RepID=UPI0028CB8405|nr:signal transducer and activator of transcription 6 isoform X1 [Gadus macrocephalus]
MLELGSHCIEKVREKAGYRPRSVLHYRVPTVTMAQWGLMSKLLRSIPTESVDELYPPNTFPIYVRYLLADWIETQPWEDFELEKVDQQMQAQTLLNQIIMYLRSKAEQETNVVEKIRLMRTSSNMEMFRQQSLNFGVMVRDMLRKERHLINNPPQQVEILSIMPPSPSQEPAPEAPKTSDVDRLVYQVLYVQDCRQSIHQQQEDLNWDKQNLETIGPSIQNGMDPQNTELQKLQNKIQKQEHNLKSLRTNQLGQLKNAVESLGHCQARLISQLKAWSWEQHKATIGHPFDDNLGPLQTWCEQLLGLNGKLRQEWMLAGNPIPELQDMLVTLQQELIKSSLLVDKQPPQVIKTQSKFSTIVRYLLGEKMAPGKPVVLKAQIITEAQARHLKQLGTLTSDNVGELINNTAILEHHPTSKSTCATFRNMSVKKIKRADRKGTESVTEEKFAILFSTDINITGCDTPYRIQIISVPVVVIVHGSQEINAMATVIWDCAFSEPDRIPFVVPDGVPWKLMCMTLNSKFMSEVQTQHCLNQYNLHFLAQKIFDQPDISGDFSKMMVSWAQFNKEMLPSRQFTFWQWFEGAMELTKRHLKAYWSEGVIFGFIGKQHLHLILKDRPNGTFLLRFSDSEIGGITIAYVAASENGGQKIQNIQPFSKRDLEIRCLGNRIIDIESLAFLYPDYPKHGIFEKYYTDDPLPSPEGGYIGVRLQTKVDAEVAPASSHLSCNTPRSEMPDMSPRMLVQPLTSPLQPFPGNSFGADSPGGAAGFSFIDPIGIYSPEMPPPTNMDVDYDFIEKLIQE